MSHIYKVEEWKSGSGYWHCNDVQDLAGIAGKWWVPARILGISLTDYILLLKNEYKATIKGYNPQSDYLSFYWENYSDMHRYVLFINKEARKKQFKI
jgi:hypothetical protein